ncbi:MAG: septation protein A, partial [Nitrosomonas sp.]|nr:septation protein A [Nitrosomonas sp.]
MKFLFDLFPVILFFIIFKIYGIYAATAAAIAATFVQIGWVWFRHRKVDSMLWISLAIIVLLGGATLFLQNEMFIKWKPTVLYWLFALILLFSALFFKKNLIQVMLGRQMALPTVVWSKLNISWIVFF